MTTPYGFATPTSDAQLKEIVEAYRLAEEQLASLVAKAVERGATGTAQFHRGQQEALRELIRESEKVLKQLDGKTVPMVREIILRDYHAAIHSTGAYEGAAIPQGVAAAGTQAIITETVDAARLSYQSILRSQADVYRRVQQVAAVEAATSGVNRLQRVQSTLNKFADQGVSSFTDRAGRRWSMDTYADMIVRTAVNRAGNEGRIHGFRQNGVNLVIASSHKACAPQCLPYQGRVLSLDGTSGPVVIDLPDGGSTTVHVVASLQEAIKNGYHHVNCRHTESAYIPGMTIPEPVETDQEDYELAQRQRQIERHIRRWKLRESTALTPQEAATAKAKVKAWQAVQREHVKKRSWLRRQYGREKVMQAGGGTGDSIARSAGEYPRLANNKPDVPLKAVSTATRNRPVDNPKIGEPNFQLKINGLKKSQTSTSRLAALTQSPKAEAAEFALRNANPEGGDLNCVRCSIAYESRRRGYEAAAIKDGYSPTREEMEPMRSPLPANADRTNAGLATAISFQTTDGRYRPLWRAVKKTRGKSWNQSTIHQMNRAVPEGARGVASADWKDGGGHMWNWEKVNGKIVFYDAQPGKIVPTATYASGAKTHQLWLVRTDDQELTDGAIDVMKKENTK